MDCPKCQGVGMIEVGTAFTHYFPCEYCDGTGKIVTNEEWFDSLSTEEKARQLRGIHFCTEIRCNDCPVADECCFSVLNCRENGTVHSNHELWLMWLREKHHVPV